MTSLGTRDRSHLGRRERSNARYVVPRQRPERPRGWLPSAFVTTRLVDARVDARTRPSPRNARRPCPASPLRASPRASRCASPCSWRSSPRTRSRVSFGSGARPRLLPSGTTRTTKATARGLAAPPRGDATTTTATATTAGRGGAPSAGATRRGGPSGPRRPPRATTTRAGSQARGAGWQSACSETAARNSRSVAKTPSVAPPCSAPSVRPSRPASESDVPRSRERPPANTLTRGPLPRAALAPKRLRTRRRRGIPRMRVPVRAREQQRCHARHVRMRPRARLHRDARVSDDENSYKTRTKPKGGKTPAIRTPTDERSETSGGILRRAAKPTRLVRVPVFDERQFALHRVVVFASLASSPLSTRRLRRVTPWTRRVARTPSPPTPAPRVPPARKS